MTPTCPRCGQTIDPSDSEDGLIFKCSACSAVLRLRAPWPGSDQPSSPAPEDEPPPHVSIVADSEQPDESPLVDDDEPVTIDFAAAAEEIHEAQDADPSEQALHEEVADLLDGVAGETAAAALGGMTLVDGDDDLVGGDDDLVGGDDDLVGGDDDIEDNHDIEPAQHAESTDIQAGEHVDHTPDRDATFEPDSEIVEVEPDDGHTGQPFPVEEFPVEKFSVEELSFEEATKNENELQMSHEPDERDEIDDPQQGASDEAGAAEEEQLDFAALGEVEPAELEELDVPELPVEEVLEADMESIAEDSLDDLLGEEVPEIEQPSAELGHPGSFLQESTEEITAAEKEEVREANVEPMAEESLDDLLGEEVPEVEQPGSELPYGHPGSFLQESAEETGAAEALEDAGEAISEELGELPDFESVADELEVPSLEIDAPALEVPDLDAPELEATADEDSLLDELAAGLGTAAAGAAAMGAAAFAEGGEEEQEHEIVFEGVAEDADVGEDELHLEFEDAARPQFKPEEIEDADELQLEPVDPDVADQAPAGAAAKGDASKPFDMVTSGMTVAPKIPSKRNLFVDLIKLGIGAVLGLSIAQAVLWWALKSDPLGIAHRLPPALSIMVPEELRRALPPLRKPPVAADDGSLEEAEPEASFAQVDAPPATPRDSAFEGSSTAAPARPDESDLASTDLAEPGSSTTDATGSETELDDGSDTTNADGSATVNELADSSDDEMVPEDVKSDDLSFDDESPFAPGSADDGSSTTNASDDLFDDMGLDDESEVAATVPFEGLGPADASSISPYDVAAALAAAKDANGGLDELLSGTTDGSLKESAKQLYIGLAELAERSTLMKRGGDAESVGNEIRQFLSSLSANSKKLIVLGKGARSWVARDMGRGVAIAGEITGNDELGELRELQIQLAGTDTTVTVVTQGNEALKPGTRVIALGVLVDDPSQNLASYTGLDDRVIWSTDMMVDLR